MVDQHIHRFNHIALLDLEPRKQRRQNICSGITRELYVTRAASVFGQYGRLAAGLCMISQSQREPA
jgi:hypothetical protein